MTSSTGSRRSTPSLLSNASIPYRILLLSILTLSTHAQVTIRGAGAYTQAGGKFYFHGGEDGASTVSDQLYALDLTKNWTTIAPAWTQLKSSPFTNSYHVATHSADNKTIFFFGRNDDKKVKRPATAFMNKYSIDTNTWTVGSATSIDLTANPPNPTFMTQGRRDFQGALDPVSGKYIFIGGNQDNLQYNNQDVFEPETGRVSEKDLPREISNYQGGALAWLKQGTDSSVYLLGGYSPANTEWSSFGNLSKFSLATETWTSVLTPATLPMPPSRQYHCAASNADGSKAIIYGGWAPPGSLTTPARNDLWILDAATFSWKQGPTPFSGTVGYAACTIAGNHLIIWGGFQYLNSTPPNANPMLLYDMSGERWTNIYTPTAEYLAMAPQSPVNPNNGSNNNNGTNPVDDSTGSEGKGKPGLSIILAGVFGAGFVVLAAVLGAVFYRRKQNKRRLDSGGFNGDSGGAYSKQPNQSEDKFMNGTTSPTLSDMTYNQALAQAMDGSDGLSKQHEMKPMKSPELAMLEAEERASSSPGTTDNYVPPPGLAQGQNELAAGYYAFVPPPQQQYPQGTYAYQPVSPTTDEFSPSTYKQEVPATLTASTYVPTNSVYSVSPNQQSTLYPTYLNTSLSNLSTSAHSQSNRASLAPSTLFADSAFSESARNTYLDPSEHVPVVATTVTTTTPTTGAKPRVVRNPQRHPTVVHQQAFAESEKSQYV
ncbi:hypothetical protein CPC16_004072 [Podila verticillata]|nr:hypothetical protein CPC16_004072 [Podila verticillata]